MPRGKRRTVPREHVGAVVLETALGSVPHWIVTSSWGAALFLDGNRAWLGMAGVPAKFTRRGKQLGLFRLARHYRR